MVTRDRSGRLVTLGGMTQQPQRPAPSDSDDPRVIVIGPGGMAVSGGPQPSSGSQDGEGGRDGQDDEERHVTDLVEQPAKVMRIGGMIRPLLDEVKAAPLAEAP